MKNFYQDLFRYNYQVNRQLANRFKSHDYALGKDIARLANHMLNAQQIWIARIKGEETPCSPWEEYSLTSFEERNQILFDLSMEMLSVSELEEWVDYRNFAGQVFRNKISDILTHIVNHSTYHRGQIALKMREQGLEPIMSDFIYYKRED